MQENIDNNQSSENFKNKVALITGVTGQDGSYLAEFLLKELYSSWHKKKSEQLYSTYRSYLRRSSS